MDLTLTMAHMGHHGLTLHGLPRRCERKVLSLELEVTQYIPEIVRKTLWWFNVPIFKNQNVFNR